MRSRRLRKWTSCWLRHHGTEGRSADAAVSSAAGHAASSSDSGIEGIASYRSRRRKEERSIPEEYRLDGRAPSHLSCPARPDRVTLSRPRPLTTCGDTRMRNPFAGLSSILRNLETSEGNSLTGHAIGSAPPGTVVLRWMFGLNEGDAPFSLFFAAIAVAAAFGGTKPALVAALASFFAVRMTTEAPLADGLLFAVEALAIVCVVLLLKASIEGERKRMSALEPWMLELKSTERQGRVVESVFSQLDEAADTVVVVLDGAGRVSSWRAGATRLYGVPAADIVGENPAPLFDDLSDDGFARLILGGPAG